MAVLTITETDIAGNAGTMQLGSATLATHNNVGNLVLTLNRTGGSAGSVSVHVATSDGTVLAASALAGTDYTAVNQNVTFAAGQTSQTVTIPILNDGQIHARRSFAVTLTSPTGGAALGTTTQTAVTISSINGIPDQRYVTQVYADLLLREADASGLAFWVNSIDNLHQPRNAIAAAFSHTA